MGVVLKSAHVGQQAGERRATTQCFCTSPMQHMRHHPAPCSFSSTNGCCWQTVVHQILSCLFYMHTSCPPPTLLFDFQTMRAQMDQHQRYLNGGRSSTTCTAIPALKWPPTRNASLVPGYPGSTSSISRATVGPASFPSASVLLQCAVLRASPPAGAIARGVGKQQPTMRMHKKSRCSPRVNKGMVMISRSAGGRQRTTTLSRKALSPAEVRILS